jgi:hypothetical protein
VEDKHRVDSHVEEVASTPGEDVVRVEDHVDGHNRKRSDHQDVLDS